MLRKFDSIDILFYVILEVRSSRKTSKNLFGAITVGPKGPSNGP